MYIFTSCLHLIVLVLCSRSHRGRHVCSLCSSLLQTDSRRSSDSYSSPASSLHSEAACTPTAHLCTTTMLSSERWLMENHNETSRHGVSYSGGCRCRWSRSSSCWFPHSSRHICSQGRHRRTAGSNDSCRTCEGRLDLEGNCLQSLQGVKHHK